MSRVPRVPREWTQGEDGSANSSAKFTWLAHQIADMIQASAYDLLKGHTLRVARVILAKLAHEHGLAPDPRSGR